MSTFLGWARDHGMTGPAWVFLAALVVALVWVMILQDGLNHEREQKDKANRRADDARAGAAQAARSANRVRTYTKTPVYDEELRREWSSIEQAS